MTFFEELEILRLIPDDFRRLTPIFKSTGEHPYRIKPLRQLKEK